MKMRHAQSAVLLGLTLLAGVSAAIAETAADAVTVGDPHVREVLPGQSNSASFMTLQNTSDQPHSLQRAESPVARTVELHTHTMEGGMMRMRPVDQVPLPAEETVRFEPGGLHLMWIGLLRPLKAGQEAPLTLFFEDGSRRELTVPVRALEMPGMHHRHDEMSRHGVGID